MEIIARWLMPFIFAAVGVFVTPLLGRVFGLLLKPARRSSRSSISSASKFVGKRAKMSVWDAKKAASPLQAFDKPWGQTSQTYGFEKCHW
eukprot:2194326-Amphidinium_carterae.1